jgi:hypothetical protein
MDSTGFKKASALSMTIMMCIRRFADLLCTAVPALLHKWHAFGWNVTGASAPQAIERSLTLRTAVYKSESTACFHLIKLDYRAISDVHQAPPTRHPRMLLLHLRQAVHEEHILTECAHSAKQPAVSLNGSCPSKTYPIAIVLVARR